VIFIVIFIVTFVVTFIVILLVIFIVICIVIFTLRFRVILTVIWIYQVQNALHRLMVWKLRFVCCSTHGNTLQYPATPCNTLQHPATPCNALQHPATPCNTHNKLASHPRYYDWRCNTLQHALQHALQHTATHDVDLFSPKHPPEPDGVDNSSKSALQRQSGVQS